MGERGVGESGPRRPLCAGCSLCLPWQMRSRAPEREWAQTGFTGGCWFRAGLGLRLSNSSHLALSVRRHQALELAELQWPGSSCRDGVWKGHVVYGQAVGAAQGSCRGSGKASLFALWSLCCVVPRWWQCTHPVPQLHARDHGTPEGRRNLWPPVMAMRKASTCKVWAWRPARGLSLGRVG